jgi:hypothetical protein
LLDLGFWVGFGFGVGCGFLVGVTGWLGCGFLVDAGVDVGVGDAGVADGLGVLVGFSVAGAGEPSGAGEGVRGATIGPGVGGCGVVTSPMRAVELGSAASAAGRAADVGSLETSAMMLVGGPLDETDTQTVTLPWRYAVQLPFVGPGS